MPAPAACASCALLRGRRVSIRTFGSTMSSWAQLKSRGSHPSSMSATSIPRSRQYPKILWIDDAEVVGDGITKASPVLGDCVAQEIEPGVPELSACGVAFVVRYIPVHETP